MQCKEVFKSCPSIRLQGGEKAHIRLQKRHVMEAMCEGEGKAPLFAECRWCLVNDPQEMPVRGVLTDQNPAVSSRWQLRPSAVPIDPSLRSPKAYFCGPEDRGGEKGGGREKKGQEKEEETGGVMKLIKLKSSSPHFADGETLGSMEAFTHAVFPSNSGYKYG